MSKPSEKKREITWKAFDQRRWGYLSYGINVFSEALTQQAQPYLELESLSERPELSPVPISNAFRKVYNRVVRNFADESYDSLKHHPKVVTRKQFGDIGQIIDDWLSVNTTELIFGITRTTQRGIERLLERALQEGLSVEDFARILEDNYYLSRTRGRLIARTEIIRASNFGNHLGAKQTGIPMRKQWLSSRDARVRGLDPNDRFDHREADGQEVELDQPFLVGAPGGMMKEELQYPGDANASPGNSINCRCVTLYMPYRD